MGVLNVTPDSFSDGGRYLEMDRAVARGCELAAQGADIIDIGGESTRPGAPPVSVAEELARVVPVIRALHQVVPTPISIDTWKAEVANAALAAGAAIVNDVSGLHRDPEMAAVVRENGAGCVLMHMRGTPRTMQNLTVYDDLVGDICRYFEAALARAAAQGIDRSALVFDPGIGFAKTAGDNLELIRAIARLRALGRPVLMGPSRKSFIGHLLPGTAPEARIWGTAGAVACCAMLGADIVRVHDVAEMVQVLTVVDAVCRGRPDGSDE